MNYSIEQSAIFDWFKSGTGNLVIEAYAGTGKTTTIKAAFEHAPEQKILYAVFNKKNQNEAKEKIKDSRVDVRTLHSLGYALIKNVWRNAKPDDEVEVDRINQIQNLENEHEVRASILKLIGFAKNTCITITQEDLINICELQDIEFFDGGIDGVGIALKAIELARTQDVQGRISFNDMVWLPASMRWVKQNFDLVCVDETQDLNLPQLEMVKQCAKGRIAVVGDSRQAIYGFRGAVQNSMKMMQTSLSAKVLTLSTTYRCPKSVVKIANEIVPGYNAAESALDGEVLTKSDTLSAIPGDAILSRLNAPLMPLALNLLRRGIPARIEGRDIGRQLIGMVKSQKAKSVPNFIEKINGWFSKQVERLTKSKNSDKRIEQSRDILDTLAAVAEGATSVADIEIKLNNLFQDSDSNSKPAVVLSSVHKAKGLEWKRVFLLTETFRRGKGIEEDNIWYVAVTRSQHSLIFVSGGSAKASERIVTSEGVGIKDAGSPSFESVIASGVTLKLNSSAMMDTGLISSTSKIPMRRVKELCVTKKHLDETENIKTESVKLPKRSVNAGKAESSGTISPSAPSAPESVAQVSRQAERDGNSKFRLPDSTYTEHAYECCPVKVEVYETKDFASGKVRSEVEPKKQSDEINQKVMTTKKNTKSKEKPGKIKFVDELLLAGKNTKAEVASLLNKQFGVVIKTAKNTVSWAASTIGDRHKGKVSKHLMPKKDSKPVSKPAAKNKTLIPKRKTKPVVSASATEAAV